MSESVPEPQPEQVLDKRVGALEAGQESLAEKVDKILGIVSGGHDDKPSGSTTTADPPPQDMAEQMRQAVRDVHAERDQADAKSKPEPEHQPREAGQPGRQRAARIMYGKEPKLWAAW